MQPTQIISLMDIGGPSFAMGDHADHIHVGWRPLLGSNAKLGAPGAPHPVRQPVGPIRRPLTDIRNPVVRTKPSKYSIKVKRKRSSGKQRSSQRPPGRVSPGHGLFTDSYSGSASSTSRSRSGRLTAAT